MHLRTAFVKTERLSNALFCDLSEFLLAVGTGILYGSPLLNALYAKCMPAVDYGLFLIEVLHAYNALKNCLLVNIDTLLLLFQMMIFVGMVLLMHLSISYLIISSLF